MRLEEQLQICGLCQDNGGLESKEREDLPTVGQGSEADNLGQGFLQILSTVLLRFGEKIKTDRKDAKVRSIMEEARKNGFEQRR